MSELIILDSPESVVIKDSPAASPLEVEIIEEGSINDKQCAYGEAFANNNNKSSDYKPYANCESPSDNKPQANSGSPSGNEPQANSGSPTEKQPANGVALIHDKPLGNNEVLINKLPAKIEVPTDDEQPTNSEVLTNDVKPLASEAPIRNKRLASSELFTNQQPANNEALRVPKKKKLASFGEKQIISPADIAQVRKVERSTADNVTNNFFTLCAGAMKLLPNKPATVSKRQEFRPIKVEKIFDEPIKDKIKKEKEDRPRASSSRNEVSAEDTARKEDDIYYCQLCAAQTNSDLTWQSHVQGKRHQKKVAAAASGAEWRDAPEIPMSQHVKIEEGPPVKSIVKRGRKAKIQPKLDVLESPCIGLDYVSEIWRMDSTLESLYYCRLCSAVCQSITIVSHIIGYRHRLCYLKATAPLIYEKVKSLSVKKSELSKILEEHAIRLEEKDGRGNVLVEVELDRTPSPEPYERRRFIRGEPFEPIGPPKKPAAALPSPFDIEDVRFYPTETRMKMLQYLAEVDFRDLDSMSASRIEFAITNLRRAILLYSGSNSTSIDLRMALNQDARIMSMIMTAQHQQQQQQQPQQQQAPSCNSNEQSTASMGSSLGMDRMRSVDMEMRNPVKIEPKSPYYERRQTTLEPQSSSSLYVAPPSHRPKMEESFARSRDFPAPQAVSQPAMNALSYASSNAALQRFQTSDIMGPAKRSQTSDIMGPAKRFQTTDTMGPANPVRKDDGMWKPMGAVSYPIYQGKSSLSIPKHRSFEN